MMRTQISLTAEDRRLLDMEAARTGRSVAWLIRDAVQAAYGDRPSVEDDLVVLRRSAGAWADRSTTAEEEVDQLRSGRRLEPTP